MTVKVILDAAEGFVDSGTTPTINHQCPPNAFDYRTPKPGSPSAGLGDTRSEAPNVPRDQHGGLDPTSR